MARYSKKSRKHSRRKMTIPLAPAAAIMAVAYTPVNQLIAGDFKGAQMSVINAFVGKDAVPTYTVLATGMLAHLVASKVGANRMLGQAGIPFIRI
jgi:hypothetical protein